LLDLDVLDHENRWLALFCARRYPTNRGVSAVDPSSLIRQHSRTKLILLIREQ
jgi:hypothetical protein